MNKQIPINELKNITRIEFASDDGIKIIENKNNDNDKINFDNFTIKLGEIYADNLDLNGVKIVETNETNKINNKGD